MPRGGRRPNAGRKPDPATLEFRAFWRNWFESEEGRIHLLQRAKRSDALLAKLIDKVYPSPQAVKLESAEPRAIRVTLGSPGHEIDLPYLPKGPCLIPGK